MNPMPTISRRELTIAIAWSAFVMLLVSGPYIEGNRIAGDRYFSGLVTAVDDGNVYLHWIRQVADGSTTLGNQYTTDADRGLSFNCFLFALGKLSAVTGLTAAQVFHVGRFLAGCLCLVSFFVLACAFSANPAFRWVSLVLVSLSSGFGWLFATLFGPASAVQPIDYGPSWVYQPEAITFMSLLVNPLFCFSLALICLALFSALRLLDTGRSGWAVGAGACLLVLANVHTYDVIGVHFTVLTWLIVAIATRRTSAWRALLHYAIMFAMTLPAVGWQWHVVQADELYRAKASTVTASGPFLNYVTGFGIPWLLAVAAAVWIARTSSPERRRLAQLIPWAVIASAVIYLPVPWQRKAVEGLHLPICLLAAVALVQGLGGYAERKSSGDQRSGRVVFLATVAVVLLSLPSNMLFYSDCLYNVRTNNADLRAVLMPPMFLEPGEYAACRKLAELGKEQDVVISSSTLGSHIAALTPCRVVAGHWAETIHVLPSVTGGTRVLPFHEYALPAVFGFYAYGSSPADRARILSRFGVNYAVLGPTEAQIYASGLPGPSPEVADAVHIATLALGELPYLQPIFSAGLTTVFAVTSASDVDRAAQ